MKTKKEHSLVYTAYRLLCSTDQAPQAFSGNLFVPIKGLILIASCNVNKYIVFQFFPSYPSHLFEILI